MNTKLTLLTLATASLFTATPELRAEDSTPPAPAANPIAGGETKRERGGQRGLRMAQLKEQLGLTDEQVEKLKPILAGNREKMVALRDDAALTKEQRMEKIKELLKSSEDEITPILNAEQLEKYKAAQQKRREAMAKRRAEQGNK